MSYKETTMLTERGIHQWRMDRARQSKQHPGPAVSSRGDHYRRKNNGIALRTYRALTHYYGVSDPVAVGPCWGCSFCVPEIPDESKPGAERRAL